MSMAQMRAESNRWLRPVRRRVYRRSAQSTSQPRSRYSRRDQWLIARIRDAYELLSLPILTVFLFHNRQFHKAYGLTWRRKFRLARQMRRTTKHVQTGTSNRAHMAMAAKIFEISPDEKGVIVEAGCWKGGTTANLSLVADIVGRELVVYDSFEGLPAPAEGDRWASPLGEGAFCGELEEVQANVDRYGVLGRCQFRKGWFSDTLGGHSEPIVAAFVDVDHQASMHQCLLGLWPYLTDRGYFFIDEYIRLDYCALFFSERYWRTYFDRPPPGLMGAGTGIAVGQYFIGPYRNMPPIQEPRSIGWTRKDFYGEWDYFPDDGPVVPLPGGSGSAHGPEGWTTTTIPTEEHAAHKLTEVMAQMSRTEEGRRKLEARLTATEEGRASLAEALIAQVRTDEGRRKLEARLMATEESRASLAAALVEHGRTGESPTGDRQPG